MTPEYQVSNKNELPQIIKDMEQNLKSEIDSSKTELRDHKKYLAFDVLEI